MAELIATRERVGGGPWACPRGGGKERGSGRGRRVVRRRLRHAYIGHERQPEGGSVGSRTGEAGEGSEGAGPWVGPHLSAIEGERDRECADRWVRVARGPGFKWIKK
jgi:hypothetical protein